MVWFLHTASHFLFCLNPLLGLLWILLTISANGREGVKAIFNMVDRICIRLKIARKISHIHIRRKMIPYTILRFRTQSSVLVFVSGNQLFTRLLKNERPTKTVRQSRTFTPTTVLSSLLLPLGTRRKSELAGEKVVAPRRSSPSAGYLCGNRFH